jgi:hypothetical protein
VSSRLGGRAPKPCGACRQHPVAWTLPRVDLCYQCLPGGPFPPPPCRRCGSSDYYSAGLCGRCHNAAPQRVEACRDCLAWGVIRKHKWLCWRCRSWRQRFDRGTCRICATSAVPVDDDQLCQLCERQWVINFGATVEEANAGGQQLFIANLPWPAIRPQGRRGAALRPAAAIKHRQRSTRSRRVEFAPVEYRQLVLFDLPRDLRAAQRLGTLPEPRHDVMEAVLDAAVLDHAQRHGWPPSAIKRARIGMRVLQGIQDTPGAILLASDALLLNQVHLAALNVIEVATAAGLMLDDRQPAIHAWFATNTAGLPTPMRAELREWFDIMLEGSTRTPRRRPRSETTIRLHLRWALPALTAWAGDGHQSLREITPDDVRAVLPSAGNPRSTMGAGLRSILSVLKTRKLLFVNAIARVRSGGHERRQPLPLDTGIIREALTSANPARAALAALIAFHALRAGDLLNAHLTDMADGRMRLGERTIPLAEPARVRIAAWLEHRARTWPNSANPHLFINHANATHLGPVGRRWLSLTLGMPARVLREDRILHEIHATGGDVRRICDLFGLTVGGALRYLPAEDPALPANDSSDQNR